jgi:hypothetical protein
LPAGSKGEEPNSWKGDNCEELITRCPLKRPPPLQQIELYAPDTKRGKVYGDWRIQYNNSLSEPIAIDAPARISDEIVEILEGKSVESIFEAAFGIDIDVSRAITQDGFLWTLTFGSTVGILNELYKYEANDENWRGIQDESGDFPIGREFPNLDTLGQYHYDGWDDEVYPNVTAISNMTSIELPEPNPILFFVGERKPTQLYGYRIELIVDEKSNGFNYWRSVDGCRVDTFEGLTLSDLEISRGVSFTPASNFREQISLSKNTLSSSPKVGDLHADKSGGGGGGGGEFLCGPDQV